MHSYLHQCFCKIPTLIDLCENNRKTTWIFIIKCSEQLHGEGSIENKFKEKLNKYSNTEFGQNVVFGMTTKALNTESQWCCRILGIILGQAMRANRNLNFEERILSEALTSMNDFDLQLLIDIVHKINLIPIPDKLLKLAKEDKDRYKNALQNNSTHIIDFYKNGLIAGNPEEGYYTVERLKKLFILRCTSTHNGWAVTSTDGLLKIYKVSNMMANLASKTKS